MVLAVWLKQNTYLSLLSPLPFYNNLKTREDVLFLTFDIKIQRGVLLSVIILTFFCCFMSYEWHSEQSKGIRIYFGINILLRGSYLRLAQNTWESFLRLLFYHFLFLLFFGLLSFFDFFFVYFPFFFNFEKLHLQKLSSSKESTRSEGSARNFCFEANTAKFWNCRKKALLTEHQY